MSENAPEDTENYGGYSVDDEDQLQPEDTLVDRGVDDALDEGYSPPERYSAAEAFGNTALEEETGETLDQRVEQEVPEPDPYLEAASEEEDVGGEIGRERAGRLLEEDEGSHEDAEKEMIADDVGIDGAGAGAEEAAVHIIDEEP